MRCPWRRWARSRKAPAARGSAFLVAERADDLLDVADLGDSEAEVLTDFDGLADANGFVVHEQVEGLVVALLELDDGARAEAHDLRKGHGAFGELDDDGDFELEDATEIAGSGLLRRGGSLGL